MTPKDNAGRVDAKDAAKLHALLESAVDAIITIDRNGIIEAINPAAARLFQYTPEEFIGRNVSFLMPEPDRSRHDAYIDRYVATNEPRIIGIGREVTGRRKDGTTFPMHLSVSEFKIDGETFFTGIIHDLSERNRAEEALRQAQKMESLGQLTGGVAHDFNNLLTVIIGNLELLELRIEDEGQRELLNEAAEAAALGARLTDRLLAFARRSRLEPKVVDLNALVVGLTDMLHRTLQETIGLSTLLNTDLWTVKVDPSQVETAIVNLAVNARDAMSGKGTLILETANVQIDELYAAVEDGLQLGDFVRLSVTDTGAGMTPQVRERVFEPFFTTKEVGHGTGLGLSMVYGFAKQSGGHVTIYSEIGSGTTVNMYLPRHLGGEAVQVLSAEDMPVVRGNRQIVLVVEDDPRVRRLTKTRLTELDYEVQEAANASEALDILETGRVIDLVFSDLVMPGGISGLELCKEVCRRWPDSKCLLTSGYAEVLVAGTDDASDHFNVLRKPYRLADLARAIRNALDGG